MGRMNENLSLAENWRNVVVIFKSHDKTEWRWISEILKPIIGSIKKLSPTAAADRAVYYWCTSPIVRDNLLKLKDLYNENQSVARIEPWSLESQFDFCKIKARESWLGFEGIPLRLCNKHVFKVIKP